MKKFSALICVLLISVSLVMLYGCTPVPVNEPYDIRTGVTYARGETELTVASFNVHSVKTTREKISACVGQLDAYDVDIAGLQEVDSDSFDRSFSGMVSLLSSGNMKEKFFSPTMTESHGENYGLMSLYKVAPSETHAFFLPYKGEYYVNNLEPRVLQRSLVTVDGVQIAFYNTHLNHNQKKYKGELVRDLQLQYVCDIISSDPTPYIILTGDFNIPSFDSLRCFLETGKFSLVNSPANPLESFKRDDSEKDDFNCIDNIIYTHSTLELLSSGVVISDASDHYMLHATFRTMP